MKKLLFKQNIKTKINCFQSQIIILHVVVSPVMQYDSFNVVVLYQNYLICIIMNINQILKNERKIIWKFDLLCDPRKYFYGGHFVHLDSLHTKQ